MVRVRSTRRLSVGGRLPPVLIALAMFAAGGCTMCPDPFDYSGPVPNGSPPQNDFRARSGGILPLGAAPRPWPQVVRADGDASDPAAEVAAEGGEESKVETVSVLQPAAAVTGDDEPLAPEALEPVLEAVPADEPVSETPPADAPVPPVDGGETPDDRDTSTPEAPVGETPGWRPRR